jgi:hypothetical protein
MASTACHDCTIKSSAVLLTPQRSTLNAWAEPAQIPLLTKHYQERNSY